MGDYFLRTHKINEITENESTPKSRAGKLKDSQEARRKLQVHSRMQVLLFRHKELLKKDILKKRALLEKELQIDIQVYQPHHYFLSLEPPLMEIIKTLNIGCHF